MYYGIVHTRDDIRYPVTFAGQRLIEAYGFNAVGRDLQDILSPAIWSHVEPLYDHCVLRAMPVYSVFTVVDVHNDVVAYERLLLPFGEGKRRQADDRLAEVDLNRRPLRQYRPDALEGLRSAIFVTRRGGSACA